MKKRTVVIGVFVVVAVIAAINMSKNASPSDSTPGAGQGDSIATTLDEAGYEGEVADWLDKLTDEQQAELDIAYEAASKAGYTGSQEEWIAAEVRAHLDSRGDVVVTLPDGGEFTVRMDAADGASDTGAKSGEAADSDGASGTADDAGGKQDETSDNAGKSDTQDDQTKKDADEQDDSADDDKPALSEPSEESASERKSSDEKSDATDGKEDASSEHHKSDASSMPTVKVGSVEAKPGEKRVAVPTSIENNPGILGMTLTVSYDESALTLVDSENGEAFHGILNMTHSRTYGSGCQFSWDGLDLSKKDVKDGDILVLYFDVSDDASGASSLVPRMNGSAVDANLDEVSVVIENGSVVVK